MEPIKINSIIRSKRKTFSLEVSNDATLTVRAPHRATLDEINDLVSRKRAWIIKTRQRVIERGRNLKSKRFIEGEEFLYLGKPYPLHIQPNMPRSLVFKDNRFILSNKTIKNPRELFVEWYKKKARNIIEQRVRVYAHENGFEFLKVRITSAQKRWGSCSRMRNLNFAWRLILAPDDIVDYVIIHELSHLKHPNHSRAFWETVASLCPDYKKRRKWLKEYGYLLSI